MTTTSIPFKVCSDDDRLIKGERVVITKAAVRKDDKVYLGWRHSEIIRHIARTTGEYTGQEEQGFVDQHGNFYDRYTAGKIAARAGQARLAHNTLISEQLWDKDGKPHKETA